MVGGLNKCAGGFGGRVTLGNYPSFCWGVLASGRGSGCMDGLGCGGMGSGTMGWGGGRVWFGWGWLLSVLLIYGTIFLRNRRLRFVT